MGPVLSESAAAPTRPSTGGHAFWWRLTDNLFRRFIWFLVPVLVMTVVGVAQARKTLEVYHSSATLSASTNPLVPEQQALGATAQFWESPSAATSRIINERLGTDNFLAGVADKAGLGDEIGSGLIDLGVLRANVWAATRGDTILSIGAQWGDAQTSYNLVAATIEQYEEYITETVASNSSDAEQYYSDQLTGHVLERDQADQALTEYIRTLPPLDAGQNYTRDVQFEIDRLTAKLANAEDKVNATQEHIDEARLASAAETTKAVRSFTVIDKPSVPGAPQSTFMKRVILIASFMLLGVVIAIAALLVTTMLDHTVASPADLLALGGISLVATVPQLRLSVRADNGQSMRRRRATQHAGGT